MRKLSQQLGMPPVRAATPSERPWRRYDWPGNVRELRNVIESTLILGTFPDDSADRQRVGQRRHGQPRGDRAPPYPGGAGRDRRQPRRSRATPRHIAQDDRPQMHVVECLDGLSPLSAVKGGLFASACSRSRCCPCWSFCRSFSASPSSRWNAKFNASSSRRSMATSPSPVNISPAFWNTPRANRRPSANRPLSRCRRQRETCCLTAARRQPPELGLDFLYLTDGDGKILASAPRSHRRHQARMAGRRIGPQGLASDRHRHLRQQRACSHSAQSLRRRANLELVPTPNAAPTDRNTETRGMVIHSASPVSLGRRPDGGAGRRHAAEPKSRIHRHDQRPGLPRCQPPAGSQGTATCFWTMCGSPPMSGCSKADGRSARACPAVRSTVLDRADWLDSAFVVNDWYISAYEPITDSYGKRIGMLYVGFLEAPSQGQIHHTCDHAVAFLARHGGTVPIFLRWARAIFRPLEHVTKTIEKVESGDLGARTDLDVANDEIGRVASQLDELLDRFQERDRQLREWNEELDAGSTSARMNCNSPTGSSKRPPSSSSCRKSSPRSARSPPASRTRSTIRSRSSGQSGSHPQPAGRPGRYRADGVQADR